MNLYVERGRDGKAGRKTGRSEERWHATRLRIVVWTAAALLLLLPLVAMQFTDAVNWTIGDFIFAGLLLLGAVFPFDVALRKQRNVYYIAAVGVALAAAFLLVWVNAAVGIIGSEDNPANLMYLGVLAVGIIGAFLVRFQPRGMAYALGTTALAQALVALIALFAGLGADEPPGRVGILLLNGFFLMLFAGSAWLFRKATRG